MTRETETSHLPHWSQMFLHFVHPVFAPHPIRVASNARGIRCPTPDTRTIRCLTPATSDALDIRPRTKCRTFSHTRDGCITLVPLVTDVPAFRTIDTGTAGRATSVAGSPREIGMIGTPGYPSAAKEGNLLFPANFTSIRCGFPDCPSLAEGDRIGTDGDRSLAEGDRIGTEGDRILAEGDRIGTESSGCRGPTGADTRHQLPAQQIL